MTGWFNLLNRVPIQSKWPAALAKTGLDQFAFAPVALSGESYSAGPELTHRLLLRDGRVGG